MKIFRNPEKNHKKGRIPQIVLLTILIGLALVFSKQNKSLAKTEKTGFAYDLLFVSRPLVGLYQLQPASTLNYLNTLTGETTILPFDDRPIGGHALSPNGKYLAVIRSKTLCLLGYQWNTYFCLPSHMNPSDPQNFFWSPDSVSFWVAQHKSNGTLHIFEVSLATGNIRNDLLIAQADVPTGNAALLIDLFPSQYTALVIGDQGNETAYLFDLGTKTILHEISMGIRVLPDGNRTTPVCNIGNEGVFIKDLNGSPLIKISEDIFRTNASEIWKSDCLSIAGGLWSTNFNMVIAVNTMSDHNSGYFATIAFFLDAQEIRLLDRIDFVPNYMVLSPDNEAIARTYCIRGCLLSILTLNGEESIFSYPGLYSTNIEYGYSLYDLVWLPREWEQITHRYKQ